jgi:hypothetical protein
MLIDQINLQGPNVETHILFMPRRTIECDEMLEQARLLNTERIYKVSLDLILLEEDLLSLEMPDSFKALLLGDDDTYKIYVRDSLMRIEKVMGKIKFKYSKGTIST